MDALSALADAAANGDDAALARLVEVTHPMVWRICRALCDRDDVDDVVQEVYLRVIRALPGYGRKAPFAAWLVTIARRACADQVRVRSRRRRLHERQRRLLPTQASVVGAHGSTHHLLSGLPDGQRQAFVLTQLHGLSYEEAAMVADCAVGTIRSRVARARERLIAGIAEAEAG